MCQVKLSCSFLEHTSDVDVDLWSHISVNIFRTVFGVTSVPVVKPVMLAGDTTPSGTSKQHFYEGIKVRPKPIPIQLEGTGPVASGVTPMDKRPIKAKKILTPSAGTVPLVSSTSSDNADPGPSTSVPSSTTTPSTSSFTPSSSILLSQLSAPPKPKDTPSTLENVNQVRMEFFTTVMGW